MNTKNSLFPGSSNQEQETRRDFLVVSTAAMGTLGVGLAISFLLVAIHLLLVGATNAAGAMSGL